MLDTHAHTLAQARGYLAALADNADTTDASSAYERALIELDRIHADDCPPIPPATPVGNPVALLADASSAIESLADHGVDALDVELVLVMLEHAAALDHT